MTRAASRIGLSQPAMSHALSRLRDLFVDELLVRAATGMEPTARAHEIALVGPLARAFARKPPSATLRLLPATGRGLVEQLERGAIDVAVAFVGNMPAHIEATVLLRDPFVVVARRHHPVAARPMSLEAYAAQNHVLVSPRGTATGALDRILVDFGLKRRIALLIATYLAVPAALAASDLIATVPSRVAEQIAATAAIAITPLPIDFATTVSMAWHRRAAGDPTQSWFRSLPDRRGGD